MLAGNMLRNLSNSYNKMGKLQQQISSGSKLTRPSDDPVAAIKGMGYRTDLVKNAQFTRNMNEVNSWLDTTDDALSQVGESLKRVQELVTQAANDTNTDDDRKKMQQEIDQIRNQLKDLANTKAGEKYIFSGTKTLEPIYIDGVENPKLGALGVPNNAAKSEVEIEVYNGVNLAVNTPGFEIFGQIDKLMGKISDALSKTNTSGNEIGTIIGGTEAAGLGETIQGMQDIVLQKLATVGAKQNRVELMKNRLSAQEVNVTKQMSNNESVEYEKAITQLITEESIHRASLSVGGRIIQPSLVDFL